MALTVSNIAKLSKVITLIEGIREDLWKKEVLSGLQFEEPLWLLREVLFEETDRS